MAVFSIDRESLMKSYLLAAVFSLALSPLLAVRAAEDPPDDPSLVKDQAKAVSEAVKHDAKVVADAAKNGAKQVAATAKEVAHEVAASARKGAERTKAAVNGEKRPNPPSKPPSPPPKPADKTPTTPDKTRPS
jgi:hypothetical protein